jgi:hypothetical protein
MFLSPKIYFYLLCWLLSGMMSTAFASINVVSGSAQTVSAGTASQNITFKVLDNAGNPNTQATVNFTLTDPFGKTISDGLTVVTAPTTTSDNCTFTPCVPGIVFTAVKSSVTTAVGNYIVTAMLANDNKQLVSANFIVTVGAPARLEVVSSPQRIPVNTDSAAISFKLIDNFNNIIAGQPVEFSLTNPDGQGNPSGLITASVATNANGVANTQLRATDIFGNYTVLAKLTSNTAITATNSITVDPPNFQPGLNVKRGGNQIVSAGATSEEIIFIAIDSSGNPLKNITVNFSLFNPEGVSVPQGLIVTQGSTDDKGVVATRVHTLSKSGSYKLIAAAEGGLRTETAVTLKTGNASQLVVTAGDNQMIPAGQLSDIIRFKLSDSFNNPVANQLINFTLTNATGVIVNNGMTPTTANTDDAGEVATVVNAIGAQGKYTLSAKAPNVGLTQNVTLTVGEPLPPLPSLGFGGAFDPQEKRTVTESTFYGGVQAGSDSKFSQEKTLKAGDSVHITGAIQAATAHVGQVVDILLTAGYKQYPPFDFAEYFIKFDNLNRAYWWDGTLPSLIPFRQGVTLSRVEIIDIYNGALTDTGTFWIWFGYRLADGTIVYNADHNIKLWIEP